MIDMEMPDGFVVTPSLWFLTTSDRLATEDVMDWAANLVTVAGEHGHYVPSFTDSDLAVRYAERHQIAPRVFAFEVTDPTALAMMLQATRLIPVVRDIALTHMAIDPEESRVRTYPLADLRDLACRVLGIDPPDF